MGRQPGVGLGFATALAVAALAACQSAPPDGPPDYVPSTPLAYDGQYLDGSFEQSLGFGWDLCFTKTPAALTSMATGGSQGPAYLLFGSGGCSGVCSADNPSSSQLYAWFSKPPNTREVMGLYFDVINMGSTTSPSGVLSFYGTDGVCEKEAVFADVPLDRLKLGSGWSTRCVNVTGPGAHAAIGVSVTGGAHSIGLDALRLGRVCHSEP
jgi:hypothetical protein